MTSPPAPLPSGEGGRDLTPGPSPKRRGGRKIYEFG